MADVKFCWLLLIYGICTLYIPKTLRDFGLVNPLSYTLLVNSELIEGDFLFRSGERLERASLALEDLSCSALHR